MPAYSMLIFDWDGTLADSAAPMVAAMQDAIAALGLPPRSDQAIRELIGLGAVDGMRLLFPELPVQEVLALLMQHRQRSGGQAVNQAHDAPLFEGAHDALQALHREGYALAIATGKHRQGLERSLGAHAYLRELLRASRCADETLPKPDPLMLRELLDEAGLQPEQALMIGDTEYDVAMARALGMPALGVACGVHEPGRLLRAGAGAVLADVKSVPLYLAGQGR
ncbi:MAG: HAD-IA family hydrolase [Nevskia sp.]|nr:HAD-IA family hydrolase [Nevskia sp.]